MSPLTLNRLLLILGVLGLFVAGVLSGEHLYHLDIPCTTGGGCQIVARSEKSYLYGIPVAFFGFFGYLFLTALALVRLYTGDLVSRLFVSLGYLTSAIGMIASLYLQYVSFFEIHATCAWCLTSAIMMIVTFVLYTILYGKVGDVITEPQQRSPKALFQGIAGVMIAMAAMLGVLKVLSTPDGGKIEIVKNFNEARLIPMPASERNQLGPDDAPVTIVEFADLCCPTCRHSFPKIHEILQKYPTGKIRIVYRHFPIDQLKGHEMSLPAIIASEIAARKGKFWDFAAAFMAPEEAPTTREGVDRIAKTVGVTSEEIDKALADPNSVPQKIMDRDFTDAREAFQIDGTPTYILEIKGQPAEKITLVKLMDELEKPEVQKLMK